MCAHVQLWEKRVRRHALVRRSPRRRSHEHARAASSRLATPSTELLISSVLRVADIHTTPMRTAAERKAPTASCACPWVGRDAESGRKKKETAVVVVTPFPSVLRLALGSTLAGTDCFSHFPIFTGIFSRPERLAVGIDAH